MCIYRISPLPHPTFLTKVMKVLVIFYKLTIWNSPSKEIRKMVFLIHRCNQKCMDMLGFRICTFGFYPDELLYGFRWIFGYSLLRWICTFRVVAEEFIQLWLSNSSNRQKYLQPNSLARSMIKLPVRLGLAVGCTKTRKRLAQKLILKKQQG